MFKVEGSEVSFEHRPELTGIFTGELSGKPLPYSGVTFCLIDGELTGIAYCSIKDQYNRNTGRKESLKDALEGLGFTREARAVFWNEYAAARGGKWE